MYRLKEVIAKGTTLNLTVRVSEIQVQLKRPIAARIALYRVL